MKKTKIKEIYYIDGEGAERVGYGFTGLVIELEDGRLFTQNSTDPMRMWNQKEHVLEKTRIKDLPWPP